MPPEPGSPEEWMRYARGDLYFAEGSDRPDALREILCYHAQQAAEKSIKALLLAKKIEFPCTHNIKTLISLLPQTLIIPPEVRKAARLSDYSELDAVSG